MNEMDAVARWVPVGLALINSGITAVMWIVARTLVQKAAFEELKVRVTKLEQYHEQAPGWDALKPLESAIGTLTTELAKGTTRMEGMSELLNRVEISLRRVEDHLLEGTR